MTITPINSITIPAEYVDACDGWYSGIGDLLYAVCSTGGLTTGTNRPLGCETDEQWYLTLWRNLSVDIMSARQASAEAAIGEGGEDHIVLGEFEDWVDAICHRLAEEYGLEARERTL